MFITEIACACIFLLVQLKECWGSLLIEEFQFDVCFHGDTDLELPDMTFLTCLEACRSRVTCTAFTLHVDMHYCRLHMGNDVVQENCPAGGFVYSAKATWRKKQADECFCDAGETCNAVTKACEISECPTPEPIANGRMLGNQRYVGAKVLYVCNHGYYMTGTSKHTCMTNGMWRSPGTTLTSCLKDCEMTAPAGTNTITPTVTSTIPGSTIIYQCLAGYEITPVTDLTLTCNNEGQWGSPPVCLKHCGMTAPAGTNTNTPTVASTTPGSTIQYKCLAGYQITSVRDLTMTCNNDGQWGSPPVCWKHCVMTAPSGTNTNTPTVTSTTPGSTIQYQCLTGYQIMSVGDLILTCTNDGQWGSPPVCWKQSCVTPWIPVGTKCRLFVSTRRNWSDSQTHCESLGANLAHIVSLQDFDDTKPLLTCTWNKVGCYPWLGMNDMKTEGLYLGVSGQSVSAEIVNMLDVTNTDSGDCCFFDTSMKQIGLFGCGDVDSSICEK